MKSCSKCGKIHPYNYRCNEGRIINRTNEDKLRSSNAWTKKSKEIRDKAQGLCEVCRDKGLYNYKNLEVHHIEKIKDRPDLLLEDTNLICLCIEHHKLADASEIDKEYLYKLVEVREKK